MLVLLHLNNYQTNSAFILLDFAQFPISLLFRACVAYCFFLCVLSSRATASFCRCVFPVGFHFARHSMDVVIPPLKFSLVQPGVFRSAFPCKENFPFLDQLHLKTIVSLCSLHPPPELDLFVKQNNIEYLQFPLSGNKEPFILIDNEMARNALAAVLGRMQNCLILFVSLVLPFVLCSTCHSSLASDSASFFFFLILFLLSFLFFLASLFSLLAVFSL